MSQLAVKPPSKFNGRIFKEPERGVFTVIRHLYAENKIFAFYRGVMPASIGVFPYVGIDLAIFETLKITYTNSSFNVKKEEHLPIPVVMGMGMTSGSCGAMLW
jgi:solute carrier family 25 phosphate transporter 23/24/25/41